MSDGKIIIRGAREHNLKNISLELPRNRLIVITGLSGSGKSSLAFDTLFAEGQRRYVESLSAYARQFLQQMQKPDVESIEGLSPSISIEQRVAGSNPRSTVGTTTEIYDYLRLLFARIGTPHCPKCGKVISRQTAQSIVEKIMEFAEGTRIDILAPLVRGRKGEFQQVFDYVRKEGFVRVRVDGEIYDLEDKIPLHKNSKHDIEVVVDRLALRPQVASRLTDSVEMALKLGQGLLMVLVRGKGEKEHFFSEQNACVQCGISFGELAPRMFSFNSPYGACPACHGLGTRMNIDKDLIIPDDSLSLEDGAVYPWEFVDKPFAFYNRRLLRGLAEHCGFSMSTPYRDLPDSVKQTILCGLKGERIKAEFWRGGYPQYEGVISNLERRFHETDSPYIKKRLLEFMNEMQCPDCKGSRLRPESLGVKIQGYSIVDVCAFSIEEAGVYFAALGGNRAGGGSMGRFRGKDVGLTPQQMVIAHEVIKEIRTRLQFMLDVGIGYLTLDRTSGTLSGGEAQRIRLATQVGSGLVGVLYILDEPSIGLHQKDNEKLLNTLKKMRDLGNTVVVVEHDEATIRTADHIVDLGPGAGALGGHVVAQGTIDDILAHGDSLTGRYLRGDLRIPMPPRRRAPQPEKMLTIRGAKENNLKKINVSIPLGLFVCITGVSGSGKSTLVDDILCRALQRKLYGSRPTPGAHEALVGADLLDKVVVIDQSPIGRTPRSNAATYTGAFDFIRDLFAKLPDSKMRGYLPGRYSFNVKGGRCEVCRGDGILKIEMHFLPDVYVECEACKGARYNRETLEVKFKGKTISDVLNSTVAQALEDFKNFPLINPKLKTLDDVGLGYIKLGQSATTLSGGEAQRVKLAAELSKRATGRTLYILDEPTTGLHFADIHRLLEVLQRLVSMGNTVLVIEHNLDVIKTSDHIIDLGPEGGSRGGELVAQGTPEQLMKNPRSYTGEFLKRALCPA